MIYGAAEEAVRDRSFKARINAFQRLNVLGDEARGIAISGQDISRSKYIFLMRLLK